MRTPPAQKNRRKMELLFAIFKQFFANFSNSPQQEGTYIFIKLVQILGRNQRSEIVWVSLLRVARWANSSPKSRFGAIFWSLRAINFVNKNAKKAQFSGSGRYFPLSLCSKVRFWAIWYQVGNIWASLIWTPCLSFNWTDRTVETSQKNCFPRSIRFFIRTVYGTYLEVRRKLSDRNWKPLFRAKTCSCIHKRHAPEVGYAHLSYWGQRIHERGGGEGGGGGGGPRPPGCVFVGVNFFGGGG